MSSFLKFSAQGHRAFALCALRDGTIDVGELSRVLSALGRVAPKDTVVLK